MILLHNKEHQLNVTLDSQAETLLTIDFTGYNEKYAADVTSAQFADMHNLTTMMIDDYIWSTDDSASLPSWEQAVRDTMLRQTAIVWEVVTESEEIDESNPLAVY